MLHSVPSSKPAPDPDGAIPSSSITSICAMAGIVLAPRAYLKLSARLARSLLLLANPDFAQSCGCLYVLACHLLGQEFEHDLILDPKLDDAKLAP
jgi:hypothetical protein